MRNLHLGPLGLFRKMILGGLVFSICFGLFAYVANAAGNVSVTRANPDPFSENKSWFFFDYDEGEVIEEAVMVKNFGRKKTTVQVYAVDAFNNDAGSFVLKFPDDEQRGVGKWARAKTSAVELKPGESKEVVFTLTPPEDLEPGEYFGGIVVQELGQAPDAKESSSESLIGAAVNTRVGSRIYLTVPGEVETDFNWNSFQHFAAEYGSKRYFKFSFENGGNVSLVPKVVLRHFNMFDREVAVTSHDLGTSLPGSTIEPIVSWDEVPFFGKFTVRAELSYDRQDRGQNQAVGATKLTKQIIVWIVPWVELSLAILLFLLFLGAFAYRVVSLSKMKREAVEYEIKAGDNIKDLARIAGVSWRTLVKINELSPPYVLEEGQKLKIPLKKK